MKGLLQYIIEARYKGNLRPVVIYGGKFQPFHAGHYEIYQLLCDEFGKDNVFISMKDIAKTKQPKAYYDNHVFTFDERKHIITKMFGIPADHIIQVRMTPMYPSWREIPVEGSDYAVISITGEKDMGRATGGNIKGVDVEEYVPGMELQSCITHKYYYYKSNKKVHLSATQVRNFFRDGHSEKEDKAFFVKAFGRWDDEIYRLVKSKLNGNLTESLVMEGGVCGHIQHLYNDFGITFRDLEEIINAGFTTGLEEGVEKTDGQPLAMSFRDGQFLFAYKGDLKPLDEFENEFMKDLPKAVYRRVCQRLVDAFTGNPNLQKWFDGNKRLEMEVLSQAMPNMVKYNRDALVFHYMVTFDEKGKPIDKDRELADRIAEQIGGDADGIEIIGPPHIRMKDMDFTKERDGLLRRLKEIMKAGHCKPDSTIFDYIRNRVVDAIESHGVKVPEKQQDVITKKWLDINKTHQFTERIYKDSALLGILTGMDQGDGPAVANAAYNDIKVFITGICMEILKGMDAYLARDIDSGTKAMQRVLRDAIKELKATGDLDSIVKLQQALQRIEALGGEEAMFPSEGIIFKYKDKMYKITGLFADYIALSDIIRDKMKAGEYKF